jgi:hypothetical protein
MRGSGLLLAASLALIVGALAVAQDKKDPPKAPEPLPVRATLPPHWKSLGLSDTQVRDAHRIRGTYAAKIDALKAQITTLHEEEKAELLKVLTDAQKARLKEILTGDTKPRDDGAKDKVAPPAKDKDAAPPAKDK